MCRGPAWPLAYTGSPSLAVNRKQWELDQELPFTMVLAMDTSFLNDELASH